MYMRKRKRRGESVLPQIKVFDPRCKDKERTAAPVFSPTLFAQLEFPHFSPP